MSIQTCNATKTELLSDKKINLGINDLCPLCEDGGVKVKVGYHRGATAATTAPSYGVNLDAAASGRIDQSFASECNPASQAVWLASLMIIAAVGVITAAFALAYAYFDLGSNFSQSLASVATTIVASFVYSLGSTFALCCPEPKHVLQIVACSGIIIFFGTFIPAFFSHGAGSAFLFNFSTNMLISVLGVIYFEATMGYLRTGCCLVSNVCLSCKRKITEALDVSVPMSHIHKIASVPFKTSVEFKEEKVETPHIP